MRIGEEKKHIKIHFEVSDEINVREVFAMIHEDLGYRIIESRSEFPDYILEDKSGRRIRAEVEFKASRFKEHKHSIEECDMIICWYNDWPDCPIEVLELCRFVEEPYSDVSFSEEELNELPNTIKKIEELSKKRDDIFDRLRWIIYDLDEFIRRHDHQTITDQWGYGMGLSCKRIHWTDYSSISVYFDSRGGVIKVKGRLEPDILSSYSREELQQIVDEAKNEGFLVGNIELKPLGINELIVHVEEEKPIFIFRLHNLIEIAGRSSEEIVKMLGSEILKLIDFMESKRLIKVVSEE